MVPRRFDRSPTVSLQRPTYVALGLLLGSLGFSLAGSIVPVLHVASASAQSSPQTTTQADDRSPTVAPTLARLQQALQAQNWAAADQETRLLLSPTRDPYGPDVAAIPLDLIRSIDQAWFSASKGRFGFRVQAKLWQEARAKHPQNLEAATNTFRDRIGWKIPAPRPETDFISSDWRNESELTYSLQAPQGHLPWAGVADKLVQSVAVPPAGTHCGSCTIDAMSLRYGRFYGYIPALMARVQLALQTPGPTDQSWQSPQPLHQINLAALYPAGRTIQPTQIALSPTASILAVASRSTRAGQPPGQPLDSALALWNLAQGTRLATLIAPSPQTAEALAIAFSANGQQIVAGLSNGNIQIWDTTTGRAIRSWTAHSEGVQAIALTSDGTRLISGSRDRLVKIWDTQTGKLLKSLSLSAGEATNSANPAIAVQALSLSPDGRRLSIATERTLQLWDPDPNWGKLLKVVQPLTPKNAQTLRPHLAQAMAFSPDSQQWATVDADNSLKLWDARTGARRLTLRQHQHPIQAIAFSPDGKTLISRDSSQAVLFWDLNTFRSNRSISVASGNRPTPIDTSDAIATPQPLTLSPDGQTFAVPLRAATFPQSPLALDLRDSQTGDRLTVLPGVAQAVFSPDNRYLVTADQQVRIWRP